MKKLLITAAIMLLAVTPFAQAQQQPSLKPSVSSKRPEVPNYLLLEVTYNPKLPPGYSSVNGPEEQGLWLWVSKFVRLPGASSSPPIRAVRLSPQFNGETADVRVTLLRGKTTIEQEDLVGVYQVGIGEQKTLLDLRASGIEPFTIKLLDSVPPVPGPPAFNYETKSIEVASVRALNLPRPAYDVTFRNLSDKPVHALRVDVSFNGRPGPMAFFQGKEGRPLIEAGGVAEQHIMVDMPERTRLGFAPGTAESNTINVRAAVFSDLSYEGGMDAACTFEGFQVGRKVWLQQLVPLLERELALPVRDHIETARQFKAKVSALQFAEIDRASSVSADCRTLGERVSGSVKALNVQLIRELDQIISTRPMPPVNFQAWLKERHTSYSAWLARLSNN